MPDRTSQTLHASAVAVAGRGLIILGASGSGKSSLALDLISRGACLIADDGVEVVRESDGALCLSSPAAIAGQIEARGVGLLTLPFTTARAYAAVTLDVAETARLPEAHETVIAGVTLPLLHKVEGPTFPAMLHAYLTGQRTDP